MDNQNIDNNIKLFIDRSKNLYEKIFNENVENSFEYIIFARGSFNPLRMKIQNELDHISERLEECDSLVERNIFRRRRDELKELEVMLMEYIENIIE